MQKPIFIFLFISLLFQSNCQQNESSKKSELYRACDWLWAAQSEDGGWHSTQHGILKSGQSLSPFILFALLEIPETINPNKKEKKEKALNFIRKQIDSFGRVGYKNEYTIDYPNYASAYALRIFQKYGAPADSTLIRKLKNYLINEQFDESRGINSEHIIYGGWGFGEELKEGEYGHVDLSHTRRILQALKSADCKDQAVFEKAKTYLEVLQKHPLNKKGQPPLNVKNNIKYDGGFYASPVIHDTNKGGMQNIDSTYFRSYATATCDGILALIACGISTQREKITSASSWLMAHPEWAFPEGIPKDDPDQWHLVMKYYHIAVRCEAYRALSLPKKYFQGAVDVLKKSQMPDGSYANPYGAPNKEDDTLLATALAVISWQHILEK